MSIYTLGETIKEQLESKDMSIDEFADRIGISRKEADQILDGSMAVTEDVAHKLADVLGPPAWFWQNLYALNKARRESAGCVWGLRINADCVRAIEQNMLYHGIRSPICRCYNSALGTVYRRYS